MTTLAQYERANVASPWQNGAFPFVSSVMECVMSTRRRFAIPSQRLRRGWDFDHDYARIVEVSPLSMEEYAKAHQECGSIYFIGDATGGDTIKIGWSGDVLRRLQELQIGNPSPLKCIGCVAARRMIEPAIHQIFATAALSGEWFTDPEGSIRRWLHEMTCGQPIERCRWLTAGVESVTWQWDEKALLHRPIFARSDG